MAKIKPILVNLEKVREFLNYDPTTGILTWRVQKSNIIKIGQEVGHQKPSGYRYMILDGNTYCVHRIVYFHYYGIDSPSEIDHKNRIRSDNRIDNLRVVSNIQNRHNSCKNKNNTSNFIGVNWHKINQKWTARIGGGGIRLNLGSFDSPEEAAETYDRAALKDRGQFCVLNFPEKRDKYMIDTERGKEELLAESYFVKKPIFKGVFWCSARKYWFARIYTNKKFSWLGSFKYAEEAATTYDLTVLKKDHSAILNFPEKRDEYLKAIDNQPTFL